MHKPEKRITDFIREHHVLTLATSGNNTPWCAHCFYAYLEEENLLVFTSDEETRHIKEVRKNPEVAGSIVLETKIVGKIQGIQFRGTMEKPIGTLLKKTRSAYLKRFPYAILMHTSLWIIKLHYIKMTDNRLGFGKKRIWQLP
jgi:uncharacterized protein